MSEPTKLAIITGTSSGIGEAVSRDFLAHGWAVYGIARRHARVVDSRYTHIAFDLGDVDGLSETIGSHLAPIVRDDRWTRIALVNNAAITGPLGPLEQVTPAELMSVFAVNATAPTWLMGFVVRTARPSVPIRIVNISSGAARAGTAGLSTYAASKAALRLSGMTFAAELARPPQGEASRDVAVLSYEPSTVDTAMQAHARGTSVDEFPWVDTFQNFKAQGRLVAASDVTPTIVAFAESGLGERFSETRYGA
ncbi:MAG TPA: SDR family NAD(P)-dependent oxidoreductase [Gemmatimonadaceae bacterium]|jgi:NAD(P)-dependent dehydrogenase (short-subunit alcohol dehydrogenase family)